MAIIAWEQQRCEASKIKAATVIAVYFSGLAPRAGLYVDLHIRFSCAFVPLLWLASVAEQHPLAYPKKGVSLRSYQKVASAGVSRNENP